MVMVVNIQPVMVVDTINYCLVYNYHRIHKQKEVINIYHI